MTFKELRNQLTSEYQLIRWKKANIVEAARVEGNGRIRVHNIVTGISYILPYRYKELDIELVDPNESVRLGTLLPKRMK